MERSIYIFHCELVVPHILLQIVSLPEVDPGIIYGWGGGHTGAWVPKGGGCGKGVRPLPRKARKLEINALKLFKKYHHRTLVGNLRDKKIIR